MLELFSVANDIIVLAAPVPDPAVIECGPGMRVSNGVCQDVPMLDLDNMQKKETLAWVGIGVAAAISLLNPFV